MCIHNICMILNKFILSKISKTTVYWHTVCYEMIWHHMAWYDMILIECVPCWFPWTQPCAPFSGGRPVSIFQAEARRRRGPCTGRDQRNRPWDAASVERTTQGSPTDSSKDNYSSIAVYPCLSMFIHVYHRWVLVVVVCTIQIAAMLWSFWPAWRTVMEICVYMYANM